MAPVREVKGPKILFYDPNTFEITYGATTRRLSEEDHEAQKEDHKALKEAHEALKEDHDMQIKALKEQFTALEEKLEVLLRHKY